jgi:hypothetical protein
VGKRPQQLEQYSMRCRWAGLADEHGDQLAVMDPHQTPATKLTFLCAVILPLSCRL